MINFPLETKENKTMHAKSPDISRQIVLFRCVEQEGADRGEG